MKTLLIIFLISTSAFADLGVVVKSTGVVTSKEYYAGDTSVVSGRLTKRALIDKSLTFDVLDMDISANKVKFDSTIVPPTTKDQAKIILNDTTKTPVQRLDALIKYLELDK